MRDYIDIGPSPCDEDCAQIGAEGFGERNRRECKALIGQLRRILGPEVMSASLRLKANPHDFGTYYEVVCYYSDMDDEGMDYAFRCEDALPQCWDAEARAELGLVAA